MRYSVTATLVGLFALGLLVWGLTAGTTAVALVGAAALLAADPESSRPRILFFLGLGVTGALVTGLERRWER